ncbi:conserved hypothetical protein [Pediculus humanus corporis]|uniref:CHK kinase-like domain-containing protein n=1 Tax=Pediculus humanus subsp. corporis TaxID=121224 RepID=E0W1A3_PEDHC|nr:uncharacterized protein Phum_PHUM572010 [Pediculus humanus corporis]EEB19409.1 conserved hypothetical protein [Pediculus humanus corporis]
MTNNRQRDEEPPKWLTQDFIENSLREGLDCESFKIKNMKMSMAAAVGDHYGSQMFRVNYTYSTDDRKTEKECSIIVKLVPPGIMGEFLNKTPAFDIEGEALKIVLPRVHEMMAKVYPEQPKLWADCYYYRGSPENIIIMEDLKLSGFTLGDRFVGLDFDHSLLVIESMAKLHATTYVMIEENSKLFENFYKLFWNADNVEMFKTMTEGTIEFLAEDMKNWSDFDKKSIYVDKLSKVEIIKGIINVWERDEKNLKVLIHGDSWLNNFMFRYGTDGKLSGMKFVDFQIMSIHSPAMDLVYFIFTSVLHDNKLEMIDVLLENYYKIFSGTLKKFGRDPEMIYPFEELKKNFESKLFWGFVVFCAFVPIMMMPKEDVVHPEEFITKNDKTEFHRKVFGKERIKNLLIKVIGYFIDKNVI